MCPVWVSGQYFCIRIDLIHFLAGWHKKQLFKTRMSFILIGLVVWDFLISIYLLKKTPPRIQLVDRLLYMQFHMCLVAAQKTIKERSMYIADSSLSIVFGVLLFIKATFCVLLVYLGMCSVFWLFWLSCQYLPSDWLERLLWGSIIVVRDHLRKAHAEEWFS